MKNEKAANIEKSGSPSDALSATAIRALGEFVARRVQNHQTLALGSGRTSTAIIEKIGQRIQTEQLTVYGIATSQKAGSVAESAGIILIDPRSHRPIDWGFDGADEVDAGHRLIKGGGGALYMEKLIAKRAGGVVIAVTPEKIVSRLGERFSVPIEVTLNAIEDVLPQVLKLGADSCTLRTSSGKVGALVTDQGNAILDAKFPQISATLEYDLKCITGVLESGIFSDLATEVIIGDDTGIFSLARGGSRSKVA